MRKQKHSPLKKLQEEVTATELVKRDLSNITEQEFRTIVIKLTAGLEKGMEDIREALLQRLCTLTIVLINEKML